MRVPITYDLIPDMDWHKWKIILGADITVNLT